MNNPSERKNAFSSDFFMDCCFGMLYILQFKVGIKMVKHIYNINFEFINIDNILAFIKFNKSQTI